MEATRLPEPVIARQLERTDLSSSAIGEAQERTIREAGLALQAAGVLPPEADIGRIADELVDDSFQSTSR